MAQQRNKRSHRKFLELIYSSAEFLLKLIEDLLDISKIESGKLSLNAEPTDFVELAKRNIQLNNTLAGKKNISIKLEYNTEPVILNIDRQKMEQVLNNLITNAVKFSHKNSEVLVRITAGDQKVLSEVIDQGVGIPGKNLEHIFLPFNTASAAGTGGEKSTGLGLFIVKKIVEGHHGKIAIESTEGKGSRFFFELPVEK